jgi:hypothetical protein
VIEGKVAKVLSTDEIVINKGDSNGVRVGMVFVVRDGRLDDLRDPDTDEPLGPIDGPEASFEVVRLGDRAALARRYTANGSLAGLLSGYSGRIAYPYRRIPQRDTVDVGDVAVWDGEMTGAAKFGL